MEIDESFIIEMLKQGKEAAYKYIYDTYYVLLCKVAFQFVKNQYSAEAVVGDVISHLWEVREKITIKSSLRSYLIRSVRNHCLNQLSSTHSKNEEPFSALNQDNENRIYDYCIEHNYPLVQLLEQELEDKVHTCIKNLPEETRVVFKKSRYEQESYKEIASDLDISVNTVKYHIKRAIALLRKDFFSLILLTMVLILRG